MNDVMECDLANAEKQDSFDKEYQSIHHVNM